MVRRARVSLFPVIAAAAIAGCSSADTTIVDPGPTDGGVSTDAGGDAGEAPATKNLFDPARVLAVAIEMPEADWDALRTQTRDLDSLLRGEMCLDAPFPSPFTWFEGRVTVDGEVVERAGVRKKGFLGSLSDEKPALKIKLNEYVPGQRLHGRRGLTLNNSRQDPSLLRTCIAYSVFERAGIPAPRCSFATVSINGRPLGIFVHVEAIDQDFLRLHYEDPSGKLYEGTLSDFRPEWSATFEAETSSIGDDRSELAAITSALEVDDARLLSALGPLVDVDAFLNFWAAEVLVGHWDGYAGNANNFFVYFDPKDGRARFMPWGTDGVLSRREEDRDKPKSVYATSVLARRLYMLPESRAQYVAKLRELLDKAWSETRVLDEIDRVEGLLLPLAPAAERAEISGAISRLREIVRGRRAEITRELDAGPPPWTEPLRDPPCFTSVGTVRATFDTQWDTLRHQDPFAAGTGTGTIDAVLGGMGIPVGRTASKAGVEPEDPNRAAIQVLAIAPDNTVLVLGIGLPLQAIGRIRTAPAGVFTPVFGILARFNPRMMSTEIHGFLHNGTLTLDSASTTPGAIVRGRVEGELIRLGF